MRNGAKFCLFSIIHDGGRVYLLGFIKLRDFNCQYTFRGLMCVTVQNFLPIGRRS